MDIGIVQQFVVDERLSAVGDAVTAYHEDFADVVLPSPLTDIADLVGLEVDDNVYFVLFQSLVMPLTISLTCLKDQTFGVAG